MELKHNSLVWLIILRANIRFCLLSKSGRERLKKNCSHAERGFLSFGEALAKEQVEEPCD
jgi:hypothetical protein